MEIEVRREPLFVLVVSILLVLFGAVGYFASPRAEDGRPVLLMPDVKAVEDYRRAASGWSASWRELDGQMRGVMDAESNSELLVMSRAAQRGFDRDARAADWPARPGCCRVAGLHGRERGRGALGVCADAGESQYGR